ncbi:MAG TPA: hypothetical protein VJA16_16795 [Thermoanaerobaculia bacterium]
MQHRARDTHHAACRPSSRFVTGPAPSLGTLIARSARRVRCVALAAMTLGSAVPAAALAAPPSPPPRHDAQERYEPRSAPGAGQALLAKFAGDWDVVKTFYPMNGQEDGKERLMMVLRLTRQGSPAPARP